MGAISRRRSHWSEACIPFALLLLLQCSFLLNQATFHVQNMTMSQFSVLTPSLKRAKPLCFRECSLHVKRILVDCLGERVGNLQVHTHSKSDIAACRKQAEDSRPICLERLCVSPSGWCLNDCRDRIARGTLSCLATKGAKECIETGNTRLSKCIQKSCNVSIDPVAMSGGQTTALVERKLLQEVHTSEESCFQRCRTYGRELQAMCATQAVPSVEFGNITDIGQHCKGISLQQMEQCNRRYACRQFQASGLEEYSRFGL